MFIALGFVGLSLLFISTIRGDTEILSPSSSNVTSSASSSSPSADTIITGNGNIISKVTDSSSISESRTYHHPTNINSIIRRLVNSNSTWSEPVSVNRPQISQANPYSQVNLDGANSKLNEGQSTDTFDDLKFNRNYFALLNAVNHRPVPAIDTKPEASNVSGTNSSGAVFYYSPETYGKVTHKNHQNTAFTFSWPPVVTPSGLVSSTSTPSPASSSSDSANAFSSVSSLSLLPSLVPSELSSTDSSTELNKSKPNRLINSLSQVMSMGALNGQSSIKIGEKPRMKYPSDENEGQANNETLTGFKKKIIEPKVTLDDKSPVNIFPDDSYSDDSSSNEAVDNSSADKYYEPEPFTLPKNGPKRSNNPEKPFRYQDVLAPLQPSIDYLEEDYESTDSFPDFKNFQPLIKSAVSSAAAKYTGPAPYRYPPYNSYYPTRFYAPSPYDGGDNSPNKSPNNVNSWSGLAGFLLGIIPLGILMASMVPAFVSVPVATAAAGVGKRRRRRATLGRFENDPVHDILGEYEMKMLRDVNCIKEILCKVAEQGKSQAIGKRFFDATLNMRFSRVYHELGIEQIMNAASKSSCEKSFRCKKVS